MLGSDSDSFVDMNELDSQGSKGKGNSQVDEKLSLGKRTSSQPEEHLPPQKFQRTEQAMMIPPSVTQVMEEEELSDSPPLRLQARGHAFSFYESNAPAKPEPSQPPVAQVQPSAGHPNVFMASRPSPPDEGGSQSPKREAGHSNERLDSDSQEQMSEDDNISMNKHSSNASSDGEFGSDFEGSNHKALKGRTVVVKPARGRGRPPNAVNSNNTGKSSKRKERLPNEQPFFGGNEPQEENTDFKKEVEKFNLNLDS